MRKSILILFLFFWYTRSNGQGCTTLGQTPNTAFPVCGTFVFQQHSVPICTNGTIPVPGCAGTTTYSDKNPYWFQFTCYQAGTLGFVITPDNLGDDYDWQLFDITGHNPNDVYTDASLFVVGNWSGSSGKTGSSAAGTAAVQCASDPAANVNTFSSMPTLQLNHIYLLMVSHYTDTQSGYDLSFGGGTASLVDPLIPAYLNAAGSCGGDKVYIKLNKRILCSSIAPDGSDFKILPSNVSVTAASGYNCSNSFLTDSVIVQLSNPLSANAYNIVQQSGTDGNTLSDNCNNSIAVNYSKDFVITDQQLIKAAFNFNLNYGCKTDTVSLKLAGQNIISWSWFFDGAAKSGLRSDTSVYYNFYGQHSIELVAQNSVCIDSAGITFNLTNSVVKAVFTSPDFACPSDSIQFTQNSIGNIQSWEWDFSNGQKSYLQNPPVQTYPSGSSIKYYPVRLTVTDSIGCSDTTYKTIKVAPNCYIAVPSAFTPNGDGLNDYLYPLNAYRATNLIFRVYNRYGQMIFETKDWTMKWDGTYKSIPQPSGTYVWTLEFTEPLTGNRISQKGTTVLIR